MRTRSPLPTPSDLQDRGEAVHLVVQLARRSSSSPRRPRWRSTPAPSGRRASARWRSTALWQRLVSPPDEPRAERRLRVVEHLVEGPVPVDAASPARPRSPRGRRSSARGIPCRWSWSPLFLRDAPAPRPAAGRLQRECPYGSLVDPPRRIRCADQGIPYSGVRPGQRFTSTTMRPRTLPASTSGRAGDRLGQARSPS